ncbi:hypothetical protein [Actinomycetospora straminea]|uniref:Uncharacterized protein n=1 Tax=Actinomycetospora straminea TaxID=663607 RepID=A0ABP9EI36_9PSEU|nr:hypothetical protein [Actinomycetospora straminea]MDD7933863.1 hypothetical protein [Actinomycetospora straminea]
MTTPRTHHDQTPWHGPFPGVPPVPSPRSVHPGTPAPYAQPFAPATPPAGYPAFPPPPAVPPGPPPAGLGGPPAPGGPPGPPRRRTGRTVLIAVAVVVLGLVGLVRLGASDASPPGPAATTAAPAPTTPALPGPKGPRPATGTVLVERGGTGSGQLTAENGGSTDAYVTLASGQQVVRGVYVRAGETATVTDVPDGTYEVYFATGTGWNEDIRGFTADRQATRYDDTFPFTTSSTQATTWTVTLTPVVGGNAQSSDLPPDAVPR